MSIYVKMNDNFMSGWGDADGKTNVYVVECHGQEQVDQIVKAAKARPEMSRIAVVMNCPKDNKGQLVSLKQFADLGEIWTGVNQCG